MALVMVMYSYLGIEIIGVTAGEAHDPKSTIKKAIDEVFWRILISMCSLWASSCPSTHGMRSDTWDPHLL